MKLDTLHGDTLLHHEVTLSADNKIKLMTWEIKHQKLKEKLMSIYETSNKRRGFVAKWWNRGILCPHMGLVYGTIPTLSTANMSQEELDDPTNSKRQSYIDLLKSEHNRAVIIKQLRLPKDVIAQLKLLYIFTVDETGTLRTIKSN